MTRNEISARVIAVQDNIVTIETLPESARPLIKNEVIYILANRIGQDFQEHIKAEILRIFGNTADAQVFESTWGIGIGDPIIQSGELLSVELGPGLLGQIFDGLQNPLDILAMEHGYFLPRGVDVPALDSQRRWMFTPSVTVGDKVGAGSAIGSVPEGRFSHKIMIPFDTEDTVEIVWLQEGMITIDEPVARFVTPGGREHTLTLKLR